MNDLALSTSETIYNRIGSEYNFGRKADPFIAGRMLDLLSPNINRTYLDIGCGTGNYTLKFADEGYRFYGIDPSQKMLSAAMARSSGVSWLIGTSQNLPVIDEFFDGAVACLTVHHWPDISESFQELSRVLKISSKLIVFTAAPEQMENYWLNHYFPEMLGNSARRMPSVGSLMTAGRQAGFTLEKTEKYFVPPNVQDRFLYSGKHKPEIYFNEKIRKGMSSFSQLASEEEVAEGLKKLKQDLDNWEFELVKQRYVNDSGDYLFLVFNKESRPVMASA
jgi:ubiquinone/menaquinone biosynthesis C-methylase UbiE